jgi:hypothetical protein
LAADTEMTFGDIRFQSKKLVPYFSDRYGYDLVISGAGDASYIRMATQRIAKAASALSAPTIETIRDEIEKTVLEIYDTHLKYWRIDDETRPSFSLMVGIKEVDGNFRVLKVDRTAVLAVDSWGFIGSGSVLAEHLAEKLYGPSLSVAVTMHLVTQIFREVKAKGVYVGGNTEIRATKTIKNRRTEGFFELSNKDDRFLWGLDDILLSAVRVALDKDKSKKALDNRIREIVKRLRTLRRDCEKERPPTGNESMQIIEFGSEYGSSYRDI